MNQHHTVLGAGPVAKATVAALLARGLPVRVIHRSGTFPAQPGLTVVAADVMQIDQLKAACQGSAVVYMCAAPPYHQWTQLFEPMIAHVLDACAANSAALVMADNLYAYQESPHAPLSETTQLTPATRKGAVRLRMSAHMLQAHRQGRVKVAIARASDYFGPGADNAMLGARFFKPLLAGKTVQWFGNPDMPHSFTYVPDYGRALAELGVTEAAWGEVWHVPNAPTRTAREVAIAAALLAKKPLKLAQSGRLMLTIGGLFIPAAREMIEMLPHFETPYVVDDSKWLSRMKTQASPWEVSLPLTVAAYRRS